MIILDTRSRLPASFYRLSFLASSCFLCFAILCICVISVFFREKSPKISNLVQDKARDWEFGLFQIDREHILKIKEEISLLAMNTRPDAKILEKENGHPRLQISFRGHPVPLALRSGQPVYFTAEATSNAAGWNGPPAPILLADSPTSWIITPIALEEEAFIEVSFSDQKSGFLLKKESSSALPFCERAKAAEWFQKLRSAKFWALDRITPEKNNPKIGFGNQNQEKIVPVSAGDFLFYASGEWRLGDLEFAKGRPLAKITSLSANGLEAMVWDETGFFHEKVIISPLTVAPYSFVKLDSLFSSLKQRNASEVSGIMGKRRVVLKPGTWWIKSSKGWKRLKSRLEVDDYLTYRLVGELIIIDGLESFQGKCVLKGRQVDPLRCHEQPFSLAVAESPGRIKASQATSASAPQQQSNNANAGNKPATLIRQRKVEIPAQ